MSDIKFSNSAISKLYLGYQEINVVYDGTTRLYTNPNRTFTVRFFDIDGTILSTQKIVKGQNATAPSTTSNYDSSNLTFVSWNNSFTNIQSDVDVGWVGKTTDGMAHFVTHSLDANTTVTIRLRKGTTDTTTVYWDDTTTSTSSTTGDKVFTRTYTGSGARRIKVTTANNGVTVFGLLSTSGGRIFEPADKIKSFHQGHANVYVGTGGFYYPSTNLSIEVASLCENAVVNHSIFRRTSSGGGLKWFNFPTGCTNTDGGQTYLFTNQSTNFAGFVLNGSYDVMGTGMINGTSIVDYIVPASLTKINTGIAPSASSIIIFIGTTPPILASTGLINGTCTLYVPDSAVNTYKTATYWSDNASQIFPMSNLPF